MVGQLAARNQSNDPRLKAPTGDLGNPSIAKSVPAKACARFREGNGNRFYIYISSSRLGIYQVWDMNRQRTDLEPIRLQVPNRCGCLQEPTLLGPKYTFQIAGTYSSPGAWRPSSDPASRHAPGLIENRFLKQALKRPRWLKPHSSATMLTFASGFRSRHAAFSMRISIRSAAIEKPNR